MSALFFPDVSSYQQGLSLRGAAAVVAKASQGSGWTDPTYAGFKTQAASLGIPFAAYHWLDTTDAAAQAKHAYSIVGPGVPLMIDDEQPPVVVSHTLAFVQAYRALGGRVVLEYLPRWVWQASGSPDLTPLADTGLHLVSSNYPTAGYSDGGPGWAGYGGVNPDVWQWTDNLLFNGQHVDFNAYRGDVNQFSALLTAGDSVTTQTDAYAANADASAWAAAQLLPSYKVPFPGDSPTAAPVVVQNPLQKAVASIQASLAADATRDAAMLAAIQALTQGGTSVDTTAVITAIKAAADAESQTVAALHAELADLRGKLAAALTAAGQTLTG